MPNIKNTTVRDISNVIIKVLNVSFDCDFFFFFATVDALKKQYYFVFFCLRW